MVEIVLRLPTYILPLALGLIEYSLRRFGNEAHASEFLPASIAAAGLGILAAAVVGDLPQAVLAGLSVTKQRVLRAVSGIAFVFFLVGTGIWFEITGESVRHQTSTFLPQFSVFGWDVFLTYSSIFYVIALLINEIKAGASK